MVTVAHCRQGRTSFNIVGILNYKAHEIFLNASLLKSHPDTYNHNQLLVRAIPLKSRTTKLLPGNISLVCPQSDKKYNFNAQVFPGRERLS